MGIEGQVQSQIGTVIKMQLLTQTDADPTPTQDKLLLEDSFYFLLEDNSYLLIKT